MKSTRPKHFVFQIVCATHAGSSRLKPKHVKAINTVLKGIGFQSKTELNRYLRNRYAIYPKRDFLLKF